MFNNNCEAIKRIQGCYFDPSEIESVCEWIAQHFPKDVSYLITFIPSRDITCNHTSVAQDPVFEEAALSIVESCKSPIDFKPLIDLLKSDDEDVYEDDFNFSKETFMKKDEYKSLDGLLDNLEISNPLYKFPYVDYNIIGEIAEIDKIINTCGFINLDVADIESTLSKDAVNYVVVGLGQGEECMADALKDAIGKLPIDVDCISKILFNIWTPRDELYTVKYLNSLSEFVKGMFQDIDIYWGCAYDESLSGQQVKVTLIASSK